MSETTEIYNALKAWLSTRYPDMSIKGLDLSLIADFAAHYTTAATQAREQAERERNELRAEVVEWMCDGCRTAYPGPPGKGVAGTICPKCEGQTAPKNYIKIKHLTAANAGLVELLTKCRPYLSTYPGSTSGELRRHIDEALAAHPAGEGEKHEQ